MLLIITSTGNGLLRNVNIGVFSDFWRFFAAKKVNCDEIDGDRPRLPANRNCCRLLRISWAI